MLPEPLLEPTFKPGDRVRLSERGRNALRPAPDVRTRRQSLKFERNALRIGTVVVMTRENVPRVMWDGTTTMEAIHPKFLELSTDSEVREEA